MARHPVTRPNSDDGATSVEYALMAMLIAGVIIAVVALLGPDVVELFETVAGEF